MTANPLERIGAVDSEGRPANGLVPVHAQPTEKLSICEQAAVVDARSFPDVDFVFFRRFSDSRSSSAIAYVVDNRDEHLSQEGLAELHRQVWLKGTIPLLYVAWRASVDILACARGADFWEEETETCRYNPAKQAPLDLLLAAGEVDEELQKLSISRLADGTFWEEPENRELADHTKASHRLLIQAVVEADQALEKSNKPALRRLLLLTVLIKYLEDRRVFPSDWFSQFRRGANGFLDVLSGADPGQIYSLLEALEKKFDGDVFALPDEHLTPGALKAFASLVEAKTLGQQRYLWEQFSFEHLPVEVISHLYQRFVDGGQGAVYTPPFLAALLVDHVMPYEDLSGRERILDPACGSGVFLVEAFRRLINLWRSRHGWQPPDVQALKNILKDSIYGVELDEFAIDLTAFSLSLAICDALQPDIIWNELHFEPLRQTNLIHSDFFKLLKDSREGKSTILSDQFDIVIGNPPFISQLSPAASAIDQAVAKASGSPRVPDHQLAYLFLRESFGVLNPKGRVCLIQPSGLLHNFGVQAFRKDLLSVRAVDAVLDFTSIRQLYDGADTATIAVCAGRGRPKHDHNIKHLVFRRTVSVRERISFELDYYDCLSVQQADAEDDAFVWRVNLLGGGRLLEMSKRLRRMRTLGEHLTSMHNDHGWEYGEGYIAGGKRSRRDTAEFLMGKPLLPTSAFSEAGIDRSAIDTVKDTHFASSGRAAQYNPPLILIKEMDSLPTVFWDDGFLAYKARIVGIHAPESQRLELEALYEHVLGRLPTYRFCVALHGSEALVGRISSVRKQDIDVLPYPANPDELVLSSWESAIAEDAVNYMSQYVWKGDESILLQRAADLHDLRKYTAVFTGMLGSIYGNLGASDPLFLNGLVCQPFYFGTPPELDFLTHGVHEKLKSLVHRQEYGFLRTLRLLRIYYDNVMLVIKPDRLRYWIRSTAVRDADDALALLREWGY